MQILRQILLRASRSRWLEAQARRRGFARRAVARFLPGEQLDDALGAAEDLRVHAIPTLLTLLGENVATAGEAGEAAEHYLNALDRIAERGLDAQISVKLTQLGLDLDSGCARANLEKLLERATLRRNFVWLDMEDHTYTDRTLELFRELRTRHANLGVCLQAYLHRTEHDLADLQPLAPAIRLVKGAYRESPTIALPKKRDVDARYLSLALRLLDAARAGAATPAFGTHDLGLIARIQTKAGQIGLSRDRYEFEMLYGIQREAQARLAHDGHRMRVLISYGSAWFPWFMRRLAERPANLWFVARNLFSS